jgi:hypothetical protein
VLKHFTCLIYLSKLNPYGYITESNLTDWPWNVL